MPLRRQNTTTNGKEIETRAKNWMIRCIDSAEAEQLRQGPRVGRVLC